MSQRGDWAVAGGRGWALRGVFLMVLLGGSTGGRAANVYWDADGAGGGSGGTGVWDNAALAWRAGSASGPLQAWSSRFPSADVACFAGNSGRVVIATGLVVEAGGVSFLEGGFRIDGGDEASLLRFSGTNATVGGTKSGELGCRVDTGPGLTVAPNGYGVTLAGDGLLSGTGRVTVSVNGNNAYGASLTISGSQSGFAGGFAAVNVTRRQATLTAGVPGALGTGPAQVSGHARLAYAWGAQGDGGTAAVVATRGGVIDLMGLWSNSADRFVLQDGGALRGNPAQLGAVRRVGAFSPPAAAITPEVVLERGGVVCHTAFGSNSVQNLGTNADVLFGLGADVTDTRFTLTVGAGTPWSGLARDSSALGDTVKRRLQAGTVVVDDGGGTVTEIALRGAGVDYGMGDQAFFLGNGVSGPVFRAAAGRVAARVVRTAGWGEVWLDSDDPQFAGGLARFIVGGSGTGGGELVVNRASGLGGVACDVEADGVLRATVDTAFDAPVTVRSNGMLWADRALTGTGSLAVEAGAIVSLAASNGLTGAQGAASVAAGAVVQFLLSEPLDLGLTQPGAVLEYMGWRDSRGHTLGTLAGNGQILTRNPEGYQAQQTFIGDAPTGGIRGALTIASPSTGAYPGTFEIRENFEPGAVVTVGLGATGATLRGYAQLGRVFLKNATNAMRRIEVAGAGAGGGTILYTDTPGSFGLADIVFTVPRAVDPGGSRVEIAGTASDAVRYGNRWIVAPGARGAVLNSVYQGTRALILGPLDVQSGARLDLIRTHACLYRIDGDVRIAAGAALDVTLGGGALRVESGRTLSGGGSIEGGLTLADGADFAWSVGRADYGMVTVTNGTLNLAGTHRLRLVAGGSAPSRQTDYGLFAYDTVTDFDATNWTIDYGTTGWMGGCITNDAAGRRIVVTGLWTVGGSVLRVQ